MNFIDDMLFEAIERSKVRQTEPDTFVNDGHKHQKRCPHCGGPLK